MAGLNKQRFNFDYSQSTVRVYSDEVLGMGSFGTVYKAKVDNFICAAKTLHFQLTAGQGEDSASVARRFQQECELLSSMRHPNIVQYFGVYEDPSTRQPLLLMELMNDANLSQYLDNNTPHPLPFHLEVNISHDVAQALAYLHSHDVIHRDLSGSNVLLIGNALKAKVCDFGTAKLLDTNLAYRQTLTMCPGNSAYMPPEALKDNPKYDNKLDCFSFGVLVVQILTRLFPQPGDRNKVMSQVHGEKTLMMLVPEVERRQNHISRVDSHHPLLRIALECLRDEAVVRPSSRQLCEKVGTLKISTHYKASATGTSTGTGQEYSSMPVMAQTAEWTECLPESGNLRREIYSLREQLKVKDLLLVQETSELRKEIHSLKDQLRQKDLLFEDVFVNTQIQERILGETRVKLEEEKRISGLLRQQVSQNEKDECQVHLELGHLRKQCEDLSLQLEQERQLKMREGDKLRLENVQAGNYIAVLQQQLRDGEERERKHEIELSLTNEELSKSRHDHHEENLRTTREVEQLTSRLHELTKERDGLNNHLRDSLRDNNRLRDQLGQSSRVQVAASDRLREQDGLIRELERRLEEVNLSDGGEEHRATTLKQILPSGDSWNVPRDGVTIFRDKEIGRGASGLVVEGRYQNQRVAVKQIHQDILYNSAIMNEFKREVRIMVSIQHPNLVRFIAAVFDEEDKEQPKSPLLVLEMLQTDLRKAYQKGDVETQYQKISIFRDIAYGLHYLHEHQQPIIHRDVSAPNILLESIHGSGGGVWRAKLSDFGSANFLKQAKSFGVGAIVYCAPEMYPRDGPMSPMPRPTTKCDVFSFGIVIVEAVTKVMPTRENRHLLFSEVESRWPAIYDLVTRCTKSSPDDRPLMSDVLNSINRIPIARPRNRSVLSQSSPQSSLENSSWNSFNKE